MSEKNTGRKLRAGIIGTGRIASLLERDPLRAKPHTHAGWYCHHPEVDLVAGADVDDARLSEFGSDWKIEEAQLYSGFSQMLARESLDLVSVCAYAPERLEMVQAATAAGVRGLWLEKALGCSLAEGEAIAQALSTAGAKAIVDYPRRSWSNYRGVKQAIEDARWGQLLSIQVSMSGQLIHTGTHAFDVLRFWCGEAVAISGWLGKDSVVDGVIKDRGGHGHLVFENGTHVYLAAESRSYYLFQFDLHFEKARVHLGNDIEQVLTPQLSKNYSGFQELFVDDRLSLSAEVSSGPDLLSDLIRGVNELDYQPIYSVENAIEALRMGIALFQSDREGRRFIKPSEVDPQLRIESV